MMVMVVVAAAMVAVEMANTCTRLKRTLLSGAFNLFYSLFYALLHSPSPGDILLNANGRRVLPRVWTRERDEHLVRSLTHGSPSHTERMTRACTRVDGRHAAGGGERCLATVVGHGFGLDGNVVEDEFALRRTPLVVVMMVVVNVIVGTCPKVAVIVVVAVS